MITTGITNILELESRLAMLEQKALEEKRDLKTTSEKIAKSLTPGSLLKMAVQRGSRGKLPVNSIVEDSILLAGDALGNRFFGHEKFTKIKSIGMPFLHIVRQKLAADRKENAGTH